MIRFPSAIFPIALSAYLLLSSCSTTGVNPTGLMGGQIMCPSGPRPTIDCRGVLQQYSRDFKLDLNAMSKVQASVAMTTTQLTQADALTSDLLQHSYQICTLYNACIVSPQDYAAKTEKLEDVQLQVRRTLASGGFGQQQNINSHHHRFPVACLRRLSAPRRLSFPAAFHLLPLFLVPRRLRCLSPK
jgi:hypothetical protein